MGVAIGGGLLMRSLSPFQVLRNAYPGSIRSSDGHRVRVETIVDYRNPDDLNHFRDRLATVLEDIDSEFVSYTNEADDRQRVAYQNRSEPDRDDDDADEGGEDLPAAFQRREDENEGVDTENVTDLSHGARVDISYQPQEIELAELTSDSRVITVPFPRAYRCTDDRCGHYSILTPEEVRDGKQCQDSIRHRMTRFPYVFVCPRCANTEQASPHDAMQGTIDGSPPNTVIDDDDSMDRVECPNTDCSGHLHVDLGDRLSGVQFSCPTCGRHYDFHGNCPRCHKPAVDDEEGITSEMRPKPIDATKTEPLLLEDIAGSRGASLETLRQDSERDQANDDAFHWDLERVASGSAATIQETFALDDVFTVENLSTVSAVYGYESAVTSRNTDLSEQDRLARTFSVDDPDHERRVYLTRRSGRGIVFDLQNEVLADAVSDGEAAYEAIAEDELQTLNEYLGPSDIADGTSLSLIPLLHAYQHAIYQAAIEEAGLEDFLAAKLLVEEGAIILVEERYVGAGGLSQVSMDETGGVLLRTLQRAEEILKDCPRDCNDGCLACLFTDDARCHPFVSREVDGYVPANSLFNRHLASEVIRRA